LLILWRCFREYLTAQKDIIKIREEYELFQLGIGQQYQIDDWIMKLRGVPSDYQ
jgi:hypothetical protein